jgi:hypothetical protein
MNGDGYADIIIGDSASFALGSAYLYLGSATGIITSSPVILTSGSGTPEGFGNPVACAGDINGDGYTDIVVGAPGALTFTGRAYIFLGGASPSLTPSATLTGPDGVNGAFGLSVASAGDTTGDGYSGVVVGAPDFSSYAGRAYVYQGDGSTFATAPATVLTTAGVNDAFGGSVFGASD